MCAAYMNAAHVCSAYRGWKSIWSTGAEVTCSCELFCECWESNLCPLEEQKGLLQLSYLSRPDTSVLNFKLMKIQLSFTSESQ